MERNRKGAMKAFPQEKRNWIVKHVAGICGVNQTMMYWKQKTSPDCKRCGLFEDAMHVWKCRDQKADAYWVSAMHDLHQDWLRAQDTDPLIITKMIEGLNAWRHNSPRPSINSNDNLLIKQELL